MRRLGALVIIAAALFAFWGGARETARARDSDGDVVIVIDAGHGGRDPGSEAVTGAYEKDCNLAIALAMKEELGKYKGVKVYLTRSDDEWLTNMGRAMVARSLKADFLISLHNNSGSSSNSGCCVYRSLNPYYSEATERMGSLIAGNLAELGLRNGGVLTRPSTQYDGEDYYTLIGEGIRVGVPSIIVEHCFLSNERDAAMLTNPDKTVNAETARKMGAADADAVAAYFGLSKRTAAADGQTTVTLERGESVALTAPNNAGAVWTSSDTQVATVDENGTVRGIGSGTAEISFRQNDDASGSCTVNVKQPEAVALTGCLDPTFYESMADFNAIKIDKLFGFVSYSDGTSAKVTPEITGTLDRGMVGIQDISIRYGELTGYLRVCNISAPYVPEVTLPAPTDPPSGSNNGTASPNESVEGTHASGESEAQVRPGVNTGDPRSKEKGDIAGRIVKYMVVLLALVLLGIVIIAFENSRRRRRRSGRGGRRY